VLSGREDFDARYRRLRDEEMQQWGRTTSFDLLLRAGTLGICGRNYKPEYAYLKGSTRRLRGSPWSLGVRPTRNKDVAWAEAMLRAWMVNWEVVAKRVGVEWEKAPLEPCDQENFLCIYHMEGRGQKSSKVNSCVRSDPGALNSINPC
jgi:hypothetical protein